MSISSNLKKIKHLNLISLLKLDKFQTQMILTVVVALLAVTNLLLTGVSLRIDLSQGQAYTLSPATKKLLGKMKEQVTIQFFASSNLPTRLQPLRSNVVDLLREYERQSGKVQVKIVDPDKDTAAGQKAQSTGIPQLQFSQMEQDKFAVSKAYFGILVNQGDKKEIIPQVTEVESLEYNLTSAVYKLTRQELPKIGIIGDEVGLSLGQDPLSVVRQLLSKQFYVSALNIATGSADEKISSSYKSLLVFDSPQKEYTDLDIKAINDYLNGGGTAILFANGLNITENLQIAPARHRFSDILKNYGIIIQENLLLSTSAELVNFGNDVVSFLTPYPFWLKTNVFNPSSSNFSNINQLTYPWVSSITVSKVQDVAVKELVKTTTQTWEQKSSFNLNPQEIKQPQEKDLKQYVITAEAEKKGGGHIVVVGSSRFLLDRYLSRDTNNLDFVLNVLSTMASGGELAGIHQRAVSFYPLPDLPQSQKDFFKYANILLLPALFAVYGAFRLIKRK